VLGGAIGEMRGSVVMGIGLWMGCFWKERCSVWPNVDGSNL
jgi:hypothetical protein